MLISLDRILKQEYTFNLSNVTQNPIFQYTAPVKSPITRGEP